MLGRNIYVLALAGGLLLNLTPCVLPMIPINLAVIGAGARAGSRGRGFALGAAYGGLKLVTDRRSRLRLDRLQPRAAESGTAPTS